MKAKSSWFGGIEDTHLNKILTERASEHRLDVARPKRKKTDEED
jgi:hypothetical protein